MRSEAISVIDRSPSGTMSEMGLANSHSDLGMLGWRQVLKLRRREHVDSGSIPKR